MSCQCGSALYVLRLVRKCQNVALKPVTPFAVVLPAHLCGDAHTGPARLLEHLALFANKRQAAALFLLHARNGDILFHP